MIPRKKPTGIIADVLRAAAERAADDEDAVEAVELTPQQARRRDEESAILLKPQPKSRGFVDGIEI